MKWVKVLAWFLWFSWVLVGLANLIEGDISRVSYACVWATMLINMLYGIWINR